MRATMVFPLMFWKLHVESHKDVESHNNTSIKHCSKLLHFVLFADNTDLFYSTKKIHNLSHTLNEELIKLLSGSVQINCQ